MLVVYAIRYRRGGGIGMVGECGEGALAHGEVAEGDETLKG